MQNPELLDVGKKLAAFLEERRASLYAAFMKKLRQAKDDTYPAVIEEYIIDRFDLLAGIYLPFVEDEEQVKDYLGLLEELRTKEIEPLVQHFASSLPYRQLVDASIIGRISHWKSEAMRRVRSTWQQERSEPPINVPPVPPQNESKAPDDEVPKAVELAPPPEIQTVGDSAEDRLARFLEKHHGATIADVRHSAGVHKPDFQKWRRGELAPTSVMSERIEKVLSGVTKLVKKPPKQRPE